MEDSSLIEGIGSVDQPEWFEIKKYIILLLAW